MNANTARAINGLDQIVSGINFGGADEIATARAILKGVAEVAAPQVVLYLIGKVRKMVEILAEMEGAK
jgi:hypothetical protein